MSSDNLFGFILINPYQREVKVKRFPSYREAIISLGIDPLQLDHGTLSQTSKAIYGIFVYELGLKQPLKPDGYWALDRQLFNGSAVIYGEEKEYINKQGEIAGGGNLDLSNQQGILLTQHLKQKHIRFLGSEAQVEAAIAQNLVDRPRTTFSIDGGKTVEVLWEWNK